MKNIYLDNAATTKPKAEVITSIEDYFISKWHNPSSSYYGGIRAGTIILKTQEVIGKFINANPMEIFFTSGASESNSWVLQGFVKQCKKDGRIPVIITSVIEHKSILLCCKDLEKQGVEVRYVPVDTNGEIEMYTLEKYLKETNRFDEDILVSIQYANNEIGTIQDIKAIGELVHKYEHTCFHTDATQAFGCSHIDVQLENIDLLSASGHKFGCPKGIGILYKSSLVNLRPIIYGTQNNGLRGGTENVPYIAGLCKAIELVKPNIDMNNLKMKRIKEYMISRLAANFDYHVNTPKNSLMNNLNITFDDNVSGENLLYTLDMADVYISTGSACNSRSIEPSYVLTNIGLSREETYRTIRITISEETTVEDIDYFIEELKNAMKILKYDSEFMQGE